MKWAIIVILIVASIVSTFIKARKNRQRREEEMRREEERKRQYYGTTTEPRVRTLPVTEKASTPESPFRPIADPFENVAVPEEGSLSPAQYYEWLCDYNAAEKAGVHRPIKTGKPSPFAVRLSKTDELAYLYKLSGFTPQNSLPRTPIDEKVKPQNPTSLLRNEMRGSYPLDTKFSVHTDKPRRYAVSFPVYPKDPNAASNFVSFYIDKN